MVEYNLDPVFQALASAVRRAIVARLAESEAALSELAEPFDMTLQGVSKHVRVLEGAGLVRVEKRHRTHFVRLDTGPLQAAEEWLAHHRAFWERKLASLEAYLREKGEGQ